MNLTATLWATLGFKARTTTTKEKEEARGAQAPQPTRKMSKKDYIAMAKVLNKAYEGLHDNGYFFTMVWELAGVLKAENPNFDSDRFINAITGEGN